MNRVTASSLRSGELGFEFDLPPGWIIEADDGDYEDGMIINDDKNELRWSIKFYENLRMDLSKPTRNHLEAGIEKLAKGLFEDEFWKTFQANASSMRPITQDDTQWSPVIDIEYKEIDTKTGSSSPAMMVIHRTAYRPGAQQVMGRFFLPIRRGLLEVAVQADENGMAWREAAVVADMCKDQIMTTQRLKAMLKAHEFDSTRYDDRFPSHCLSRIRKAMAWFFNDSHLVVTDAHVEYVHSSGAEITLTHLGCTFRPPPRFLYCPNPLSPESNKQRFCRATFGGSVGVEMMVVSSWHTYAYAPNLRKGVRALQQIAHHGALSIHRAQSYLNIRVRVEDVPLMARRSWLSTGSKEAVITIVDCEESGGVQHQNTIGWIREPHSEVVYLIYYLDAQGIDPKEIRGELLESLSSLRGVNSPHTRRGRRNSKKDLWNPSGFSASTQRPASPPRPKTSGVLDDAVGEQSDDTLDKLIAGWSKALERGIWDEGTQLWFGVAE